MIETQNLTIGFKEAVIVEDINVSIRTGAITTVIGVNGCGKSTLVKTMAGILSPLSGDVTLWGKAISSLNRKRIAQKLAYLSQRNHAPEDITVEELVYYGRFPHKGWLSNRTKKDEAIVRHCLEVTDMVSFKDRRLSSLSGGEGQRAWIAMSLAQEPEILILDEPTTYMDIAHQMDIMELLYALNVQTGLTILMVLHDINQAIAYSHDIVILHEGRVFDQGPPETVLNSEVIHTVFNLNTKCICDDALGMHYIPYTERKVSCL